MRAAVLFALCPLALAQGPDPAYEVLARAYDALRARDYDSAIADFLKGIEAAPNRASIRKDLAYAYLKAGENVLARDQFREAMALDAADTEAAMEYAFLCYETKERVQARRVFDRIRKAGAEPFRARAEQAFENIDAPLAAGIERWRKAIEMGADDFSAHFELAALAEERDELALAEEHYEKAWRVLPDRRSVLVDLGRVWKAQGRVDEANAALLAASRGGEARAAEMARELLPERYPYVAEFRRALEVDAGNAELRRELAYLLLKMGRQPEAEVGIRAADRDRPRGSPVSHPTRISALRAGRGGSRPAVVRPRAGGKRRGTGQSGARGSSHPAIADAPRSPAGFHRRQGDGRAKRQSRLPEGRPQIPRHGARSPTPETST